eukprot:Awhi_evm1s12411
MQFFTIISVLLLFGLALGFGDDPILDGPPLFLPCLHAGGGNVGHELNLKDRFEVVEINGLDIYFEFR